MEEKNCLFSPGRTFHRAVLFRFSRCESFVLVDRVMPGDMFELFNAVGLPSTGQTKIYASQVLLGLESIHEKGYIYRDIKPENLLIRENGSIAICDFGFAKKLSGSERILTCQVSLIIFHLKYFIKVDRMPRISGHLAC